MDKVLFVIWIITVAFIDFELFKNVAKKRNIIANLSIAVFLLIVAISGAITFFSQ